jgi:pimeloyl-ACP methyl ester carboxylesterase
MSRLLFATILGLACTLPARAASVDGLNLYSSSVGSGPTIVFVHGWTCDTSSWAAQVPAFADDYRVITLDLPGHGRSGSPANGEFSMEQFARAVEAVRAESGADEVVIVGHSMGVVVARQYALDFPDRVAGVVAVDGPLDVRGFGAGEPGAGQRPALTPEAREGMIRGMFVAETPVALQEHILAMMLGAPEATANGAMAAVFSLSASPTDVIEAPALAIVAGTAQVPSAEALEEIVPNFEGTRIEGTGHFLMMEKPEEFNRLLDGFLDQIDF